MTLSDSSTFGIFQHLLAFFFRVSAHLRKMSFFLIFCTQKKYIWKTALQCHFDFKSIGIDGVQTQKLCHYTNIHGADCMVMIKISEAV